MEKEKTMYMIGNAHIDPVWLWNWQEVAQEVPNYFHLSTYYSIEFQLHPVFFP